MSYICKIIVSEKYRIEAKILQKHKNKKYIYIDQNIEIKHSSDTGNITSTHTKKQIN